MTNPENNLLYDLPFDGKRVIEIGSGAGGFTLMHLTRAGEVVCVEKDPDANQLLAEDWQAEGHPARLTFNQSGIEELDPAQIGQFDFAVFSNSFWWIHGEDLVQVHAEVLHKIHRLLIPGGRVVLTQPNPDPYQVTVTSGDEVLHAEMVLEPNFSRVVETTLRSYRRAEAEGLFRITSFPGVDGEAGVVKAYDYPSLDVWLEETSTFSIDRPVLEEVAGRIAEIVKDRLHTITNRYKEDLIIMEKV